VNSLGDNPRNTDRDPNGVATDIAGSAATPLGETFPSPLTQGSRFASTPWLVSAATRVIHLCVISQRKHDIIETYEMSKMRFQAQFG
jgi:hypothetical protein